MGAKLDSYIDGAGNTVMDDDVVIFNGREYVVIYISHNYVNLKGNGNIHLPFSVGIPVRKISNAKPKPQGPVFTETVTRKRIVDGVHGGVEILKRSDGTLMFGLAHDLRTAWASPNGNMVGPMSRDDLTDAIETLTQIRDAMSS